MALFEAVIHLHGMRETVENTFQRPLQRVLLEDRPFFFKVVEVLIRNLINNIKRGMYENLKLLKRRCCAFVLAACLKTAASGARA
jgi:hypothetical protein